MKNEIPYLEGSNSLSFSDSSRIECPYSNGIFALPGTPEFRYVRVVNVKDGEYYSLSCTGFSNVQDASHCLTGEDVMDFQGEN